VAGSDLVWLLAERAAGEGRRLYLLGGDDGVAERAASKLRAHAPNLEIAGTSSPRISMPPTEAELAPIRLQLQETQPDLVFAAFGAPKQEYLAEALREDFPRIWWLGCGISLSFITGEIRRAPDWMQRTGLEWIHRLGQEPRRLAWRYLRRNLPFFFRLWLRALRSQR
jgi:N-acetylglucosaminyldiphosphoundecaprenol N-acetyl-beta-D-mannosaminyltransferase